MQHSSPAGQHQEAFPTSTEGLEWAANPEAVALEPGTSLSLRIAPVRKRIGEASVRMLAYNGSIPGPTLRVREGSEIAVEVANEAELDQTVHWHGLRLENQFDGVPHDTQAPIPPGGRYTHRLRFPDPGIYWYHPHIREDYAQELGLYGTLVVAPTDPSYWPPVHRELTLTLDDVLIEDGRIAPFSRSGPDRTAMGRFGNVTLTNGDTDFRLTVRQQEVVRLYLVNTANTRVFNVRLPGARMKLIGGDSGRCEHETFADQVLLAPSERAVVDVCFEHAGVVPLEHRTPERTYRLGALTVTAEPAVPSLVEPFGILRSDSPLRTERARLDADLSRPPDRTLALVGEMPGMHHHHTDHGMHHDMPHDTDDGTAHDDGIEWEDTMPDMNLMSTTSNMHWKLIDRDSAQANEQIDWVFGVGDRIKIRLINEPDSDHPMHHPFHVHGERFLVLSRNGEPNPNLGWKDTVLIRAGETIDILLDASNPGLWMAHCHIAEHAESGMMFNFRVTAAPAKNTSHDGPESGRE